ncbi:MAG: hypothetical protein ACLUIQ_11700 [Dialister invisus]
MQIALVGKYVRLHDAYLSVAEALSHAGYAMGAKVNIRWINSEILEEENRIWMKYLPVLTVSSSLAASATAVWRENRRYSLCS